MCDCCSDAEDIGGDAGIADENRAILERVRMNTRQEYLAAGKATGSVRATDRLMRELQDIYRSKNYKSGECLLSFLPYPALHPSHTQLFIPPPLLLL